jgi:hypothetical protein
MPPATTRGEHIRPQQLWPDETGAASATGSTSATDGQPPPSQHPSTFCLQSSHHQAERIQKRRWGIPVIPQSTR